MQRVRFQASRRRAGFTLIELLCAVAVLLLGTLGFSRALVSSLELARSNRERTLATEAARRVLEEIRDQNFAQVFALYDASTANDPGGTAPGAAFDVEGLTAQEGDADGRVGEIVLPVLGLQLREDVNDAALGMPHDLDADGAVDALDHSGDYKLLPVLVRVAWKTKGGPMQVELKTIVSQR